MAERLKNKQATSVLEDDYSRCSYRYIGILGLRNWVFESNNQNRDIICGMVGECMTQ